MKVIIELDFGKVKPGSKRAQKIADAVCEEAERIRIAFDANEVGLRLVDNATETEGESK